jgi:hypothetical protein
MEKQHIDKIRKYYNLPEEISDKEISDNLTGSIGDLCVKLDAAIEKVKKGIHELVDAINQKLRDRK